MTNESLDLIRAPGDRYIVEGLDRNQSMWVQIGHFDVRLGRTDEGLVVDIYPAGSGDFEPLGSTYAFDNEAEGAIESMEPGT